MHTLGTQDALERALHNVPTHAQTHTHTDHAHRQHNQQPPSNYIKHQRIDPPPLELELFTEGLLGRPTQKSKLIHPSPQLSVSQTSPSYLQRLLVTATLMRSFVSSLTFLLLVVATASASSNTGSLPAVVTFTNKAP